MTAVPVRRSRRRLVVVLAVVVGLAVAAAVVAVLRPRAGDLPVDYAVLRGVNVYTLEQQRTAPTDQVRGEPASSYRYLAGRGVKLIRLAVPWQKLQPPGDDPSDYASDLDAPLDPAYLSIVRSEIGRIEDAGMFPVLDLHNGCSYPSGPGSQQAGTLYCGHGLSTAQAVEIWQKLSDVFRDDDRIAAYDLFNEPRVGQVDPAAYRDATQAVVTMLRDHHDDHAVWVETLQNQSMQELAPRGPWIDDPAGRTEYSAHFYPNYRAGDDFAYALDEGAAQSVLDRITQFGQWCQNGKVRCSIGEIGWPGSQTLTDDPDSLRQWNDLGTKAYAVADRFALDVTFFGASSLSDSALWAYGADADDARDTTHPLGIDRAFSQAEVIEAHPSVRAAGRSTGPWGDLSGA